MIDILHTHSKPRDIKVVLLYPPAQSPPKIPPKPNGSLAYPCLAGALLEHGVETSIFDACVGRDKRDELQNTFYRSTELPNGLQRTGVPDTRILEEIADADIVGLTSIFSAQESITLSTARLIKKTYPEKLIVAGGVNARCRMDKFFESFVDVIFLSEAEKSLCALTDLWSGRTSDWNTIHGIAFRDNGKKIIRPARAVDTVVDLDQLPLPAWHLLPNETYWKIARPHGKAPEGKDIRYASMMTSLGCVFSCSFCHIAGETENDLCGAIGRFRTKSDERVMLEIETLKQLGVTTIYLEDDTFFGRKKRAVRLLHKIQSQGMCIMDVNGVNIAHLLKRGKPDLELLDSLVAAGFKEITLPFESGSQRVLAKYASNKWKIEGSDIVSLISSYKNAGITIAGNYMIGFPDETREEMQATINMAKIHMGAGLNTANFHIVLPLPGTPLFELAIKEEYLPKNFNMDRMSWRMANMVRTTVPPKEIEELRDRAWQECNNKP